MEAKDGIEALRVLTTEQRSIRPLILLLAVHVRAASLRDIARERRMKSICTSLSLGVLSSFSSRLHYALSYKYLHWCLYEFRHV
eukprot:4888367-Pleurochrysis_carterae.AAC.1